MKKIQFHYADSKLNLAQKTHIKNFIESIFKKEKKKLQGLNYIFCSDEYLLKINRDFLQHDYYTDIITFASAPPAEIISHDAAREKSASKKQPAVISGDIYISIDRVKDNAKQFQQPVRDELHRVMAHGVLHLCGYGDKTSAEEKKMRKMEEQWLALRSF